MGEYSIFMAAFFLSKMCPKIKMNMNIKEWKNGYEKTFSIFKGL